MRNSEREREKKQREERERNKYLMRWQAFNTEHGTFTVDKRVFKTKISSLMIALHCIALISDDIEGPTTPTQKPDTHTKARYTHKSQIHTRTHTKANLLRLSLLRINLSHSLHLPQMELSVVRMNHLILHSHIIPPKDKHWISTRMVKGC